MAADVSEGDSDNIDANSTAMKTSGGTRQKSFIASIFPFFVGMLALFLLLMPVRVVVCLVVEQCKTNRIRIKKKSRAQEKRGRKEERREEKRREEKRREEKRKVIPTFRKNNEVEGEGPTRESRDRRQEEHKRAGNREQSEKSRMRKQKEKKRREEENGREFSFLLEKG